MFSFFILLRTSVERWMEEIFACAGGSLRNHADVSRQMEAEGRRAGFTVSSLPTRSLAGAEISGKYSAGKL